MTELHQAAQAMPDGKPVASRDAPVGGQAVLEGVMMRGVSTWAVAVRKPDGLVEVSSERGVGVRHARGTRVGQLRAGGLVGEAESGAALAGDPGCCGARGIASDRFP